MAGFDVFLDKESSIGQGKSKLKCYLNDKILPRTPDFDVLTWWRLHGAKYPILQRIPRDIIVIPVSTVASKSAFSIACNILSPHRNRLHSNTLGIDVFAELVMGWHKR